MKFIIATIIAIAAVSADKRDGKRGDQRAPWAQDWENDYRQEREAEKEAARQEEWLGSQRKMYEMVSGWAEPALESGEGEEAAEPETYGWKDLRSGRKGKGKGQASKQMFYAGMNYDNWDEEQGWGNQNAYKESWEGMQDWKPKNTKDWGPQDWFNAGREWQAPEEEVYPEEDMMDEPDMMEEEEPMVYPDEHDDYSHDDGLIIDDLPLDDYALGEGEDEMVEDDYLPYIPSRREQRNMYRTAQNEYRDTRPTWNDYMPEETQLSIDNYRESYEGKKPWWKSEDFDIDMDPVREGYGEAMNDWRSGRPTWDSWMDEQEWW